MITGSWGNAVRLFRVWIGSLCLATCLYAQSAEDSLRPSLALRPPVAAAASQLSIADSLRMLRDVVLDPPQYRLPGEFERQRAILLSSHEFVDDMPDVLNEIILHLQGNLDVIVLVNDVSEYQRVRGNLIRRGVPLDAIHFAEVPHDTMWCRDYGPVLVEGAGGQIAAVDAEYVRGTRPNDDDVPLGLCRQLDLPILVAPLRLEGGNLLSNGQGLCLTTRHVLETNADQSDEYSVRRMLNEYFGAKHVVFLESLVGEPTGHVDMFATFTSANTVVVGAYHPDDDPINAEILDRNAERLARVRIGDSWLRVVRVPMPRRDEEVWRTYTNVVYANGVMLVPVYPECDETGRAKTLWVYAQLLPGWQIVPIDAARLVELGGAMHCVTMNLGPLTQIPRLPSPRTLANDFDRVVQDDVPPIPRPREDDIDVTVELEGRLAKVSRRRWADVRPIEPYRVIWQRQGYHSSTRLR